MEIDEKKTLRFNGFPMRVHLWGESFDNPLIVFVHGGPGNPFRHKIAEHLLPLTDSYTLVAYDQRGTGGSYRPYLKPKDISVEAYVDDLLSLCSYLLRRFKQNNLYIIGESFGSYIASLAVLKKPSLFKAYIGYGQMVDDQASLLVQYEETYKSCLDEGDNEAVDILEAMGKPENGKFHTKRQMNDFLYLFYSYVIDPYQASYQEREVDPFYQSEENSASEAEGWEKGKKLISRAFSQAKPAKLLPKEGLLKIEIPYHVIQGLDDLICPALLLPEFMERVEAPEKSLTLYPHCGHLPSFENPARFMRDVREKFR